MVRADRCRRASHLNSRGFLGNELVADEGWVTDDASISTAVDSCRFTLQLRYEAAGAAWPQQKWDAVSFS